MSTPRTSSGSYQQQQQQHSLVWFAPPPQPPPTPPLPKLPRSDLLEGRRGDYIRFGVPLYKAAIKGDWKAAKRILEQHSYLIRFAITDKHETLLHIAASAENTKAVEEFVKNLVGMMEIKDLELQNKNYDTPFSLAAAAGNVKTATVMVKKNPALSEIPGKSRMMPLDLAASFAKAEMVSYLYDISNKMRGKYWEHEKRCSVLRKCVEAEIFDVAIKIVNDCPELTADKKLLTDVLLALAQKTQKFKPIKPNFVVRFINSFLEVFHLKLGLCEKESEALQLLRIIWKIIANMPRSEIDEIIQGSRVVVEKDNKEKECEIVSLLRKILERLDGTKSETEKKSEIKTYYPFRVLFVATKMGNTRFIVELIRLYPDLIWKIDDKGKTIFHLAIKRRQIEIYKLLYEIGAMKELITPIKDENGNNMLHMVAKSAKQKRIQNVSGVAFQMQRELLWFKEVEKMIPPNCRKEKNKYGKTPQDLFTKTHAELLKAAERWIKVTASQCMVVATLTATIVFAAAFTLPGGYNEDFGIPFFRKEPSLIVFVISDAISLIFSSISVLIFLSILTSRYAEHDFLKKLPRKLVNGIVTLFLSIVTMMIAFSASFFVLYNKKLEWVPFTLTSLAGIPVILCVALQFGLFIDVLNSAYGSRDLFERYKRVLYY